jgi:hypothetical protein
MAEAPGYTVIAIRRDLYRSGQGCGCVLSGRDHYGAAAGRQVNAVQSRLLEARLGILERPDVRSFALEDPQAFLAQFPRGAALDEVQR